MIDQATANTVGLGLRLRATPENDLFGMDEAAAQKWRKKVEARWNLWADNKLECDIEGTRTIAQMVEAAQVVDRHGRNPRRDRPAHPAAEHQQDQGPADVADPAGEPHRRDDPALLGRPDQR